MSAVCSAELWDDLLRQIRLWTRMGFPPDAIQVRAHVCRGSPVCIPACRRFASVRAQRELDARTEEAGLARAHGAGSQQQFEY
jgi:hypothetical protein